MKSLRLKRLNIIGITMIIIVLPFGFYYLFFVSSQTNYFSKRNFRVLAEIGQHISGKIDNLANNLMYLAEKAKQDKTETTKIEGKSDATKEDRKQSAKPIADVQELEILVPDLKVDRAQYQLIQPAPTQQATVVKKSTAPQDSSADTASQAENPPDGNTKPSGSPDKTQRAGTPAPALTTSTSVSMSVKPEQGSFWLYLEYREASDGLPANLLGRGDLKTLIEPLVSRHVIDEMNEGQERLFDEVLVAEQGTGRVIFQRGSSGVNVVTLDSILNSKGGKLELKLADQSSTLSDVQIAGTEYKLFLQPIRLTLSAGGDQNRQGVRWVVCGLTRTNHFRDETFAVSYTVLISFVFVVLLAVLSWPLLKLKLMGPKDRLRRADLGLTLLSALLGTALVTFILLDAYAYIRLEDTLDRNLEQLSGQIKANFQNEIARALAQLGEFNSKITTLPQEQSGALKELDESIKPPASPTPSPAPASPTPSPAPASPTPSPAPASPPPASPPPALSSKLNIFTDGVEWTSVPYRYFRTATWTDPTGQQRIKWTTQPDTTAFLDVSKRQFFQNVINNTLWRNGDIDYYLEIVKSRTTGLNAAIVATPMPKSSWVSNIDTRLLSLMDTVLPAGYGYAVIDRNGQVQFHSDEAKNLEEQFFAECENDRRLRAAVMARTDRFTNTTYLGKGHRLYVSALPGTPWMLVVFRDKDIARTINLELITLSLMLFLGFALILIPIAVILIVVIRILVIRILLIRKALISRTNLAKDGKQIRPIWVVIWKALISPTYLPKDGERIKRWWPDRRRARQYEWLIALNVVIGVIFVVALQSQGGWCLVSCCVALPVLATGMAALILGKRDPLRDDSGDDSGSARARRYRTTYPIAVAGLLVLASVLPAAGFFQIARNFESKLMIKHGQVSIAKELEKRTQRVNEQYALINLLPDKTVSAREQQKNAARFIDQRLHPPLDESVLDVYDSFFFGTTFFGPKRRQSSHDPFVDEKLTGVDWLLAKFRPIYNQSCVESQDLARSASSDGLWRWQVDGAGRIRLDKDKEGRKGDLSVELLTNLPPSSTPDTLLMWTVVIVVVVLLLLSIYLLARFVARRFFLLDMDLPSPAVVGGSYVLLRSAMAPNGKECYAEYHVEHLSAVKNWTTWRNKLAAKLPAKPPEDRPSVVLLDNFEHCMDEPEANRQKLEAIEYLLNDTRQVIVASTADPLRFSLSSRAKSIAGDNGKVQNAVSSHSIQGLQHASASIEEKQTAAAEIAPALIPYQLDIDTQARWASAFTNFAMVFSADSSTSKFVKDHPDFLRILRTNQPWRYIELIGEGIAQNETPPGKNNGDRADKEKMIGHDRAEIEELISQVMEQAQPYHEVLWKTCSEGQRCTLIQLAQDGMISPQNKHLRRLVKRGLVVRDPGLRLMDESFRRFVISAAREQDLEGWRHQEGGSAWQAMKVPFLLIVVSVALFLFITQKDLYDSSIGFISAATGGVAVLFRFLGMFQRGRSGSAVQS